MTTSLTMRNVGRAQRKALLRLMLFITGQTHALLHELSDSLAQTLHAHYQGSAWSGHALTQIIGDLEAQWGEIFTKWQAMVNNCRREAGGIAFGVLAVTHDTYVLPALRRVQASTLMQETSTVDFVFSPQLEALLVQAAKRQYGGYVLSQRLWNLRWSSERDLKQVVYNGIARGDSAYRIGKQLESFLGFGADCPRWTTTRLRLTKGEIAGGRRSGLYSGQECRGQGVAYNALRLARNEIQIGHAMTTDYLMQQAPFIEEEQIVLSPSHPVDDICDQTIRDGKNGMGIYPKGTISLPIHVQCLCTKIAVTMKQAEFDNRLKGWLDGTQQWAAMDTYRNWLGGDLSATLMSSDVSFSLLRWFSGTFEDMRSVIL